MSAINGPVILLILAIIGFTIYAAHSAAHDLTERTIMHTDEQHAEHLRQAAEYGTEYAKTLPGLDSPLSGEYADGFTTDLLLERLGLTKDNTDPEDADFIYQAFEDAYHAANSKPYPGQDN